MVKKVLTWALVIFLLALVIARPTVLPQAIHALGDGLLGLGRGFGDFFTKLVR